MAYHFARSLHFFRGFASLTLLVKNSFLDEMGKLYVLSAKAKGCSVGRIFLCACVP